MCDIAADISLRCWHSDGHLGRAVGGVALLPGVVVVGWLRWVLPLDVLPLPCPPSSSSVHPHVGLVEKIRHVLYALLPPGRVGVSSGGAVHGGGRGRRVPRGGGLPVNVAAARLPGFEGRAGEERVRGGLGEACVLQMAGGDGDGQRCVEVVVRWQGLVDVGLLFGLHWYRLEGRRCHRLVLREVHEREALVVATRRTVRCNEERSGAS